MEKMTENQRRMIFARMKDANIVLEDLESGLGIGVSDLTKDEASLLIGCFIHDGDLTEVVRDIRLARGMDKGEGSLDAVPKSEEEARARKENKETGTAPPVAESEKKMKTEIDAAPSEMEFIRIGDIEIAAVDIQNLQRAHGMLNKIYTAIMQKGTDYDVIPGTQKPTLLKPGAELLRLAFGFDFSVEVEKDMDDWSKGIWGFTVKTTFSKKGHQVGVGVGSANSMETRYANRWLFKADFPAGTDLSTLPSRTLLSKKTGEPYTQYLVEARKDERATQINTLLKMAKKRSFVDGILSITGASRIFTQDVEDF